MVWHLGAFGDQTEELILEVGRTVGNETVWDTERGAPFYEGGGGGLGESFWEREEPLVVRMVVA